MKCSSDWSSRRREVNSSGREGEINEVLPRKSKRERPLPCFSANDRGILYP